MPVSLRPYAEDDADAVTAIWLASWLSTGVPAPVTLSDLRERWPRELAKGWAVHVASVNGEIAGFLALEGDHLRQLFIAPAHQGQSIGKMMLDFVKLQCPQGFYLTTALKSRAEKFYRREGLVAGEVSRHHYGHEIIRYDWRPDPHNG